MFKVGNYQGLRQRLDKINQIFLLRAINDYELEELLDSGPERFFFHRNTLYETVCGNMIARYGRSRSGTIVLHIPSEEERNGVFEIGAEGGSWGKCLKDYVGVVEVYNINEEGSEGMERRIKQLRILRTPDSVSAR